MGERLVLSMKEAAVALGISDRFRNGLLVVGDALVRRNLAIYFPHESVSTDRPLAVQSAHKLAGLAFDTICFGHGPPITSNAQSLLQACLNRRRR